MWFRLWFRLWFRHPESGVHCRTPAGIPVWSSARLAAVEAVRLMEEHQQRQQAAPGGKDDGEETDDDDGRRRAMTTRGTRRGLGAAAQRRCVPDKSC